VEAVRIVSASCEVAVVGLGPVGAVLCALLGARGIDVIAVEPDPEPPAFPRAIAADDEMLRTLLQLPGLPNPVALFDTDQRVEVRNAAGRLITSVDFGGSRMGVSGLSFFHQPTLERALRTAAQTSPTVDVRFGRRVVELSDEPHGVRLGLDDGTTITAGWVIACDGATSAVRGLRRIAYTGRTFSEPWLVIDLDSSEPLTHLPCFAYVLDRRRPAVNMPRPGGHRFEFMLMPGEDPGALASASSVQQLLEPYLAPLSPTVRGALSVVRATVYTYHSRLAERWRDGRVLLAGDAAHCMPPFGGQGLGAGIGDALALAWRLEEVIRGLSEPAVLDGYEAERRPRVAEMNRTALIAGRLLTARSRAGALAATGALRLMNATPWVGARFRAGALRPPPKGSLPNPRVLTQEGVVMRLDDVLAPGWSVLGRGVDPLPLLSADSRRVLAARSAGTLVVLAPGELARADSFAGQAVEDLEGTLLALWSTANSGQAVLVRPNRFVESVPHAIEGVRKVPS
jgi:3-(3-hydroxy-phenyl)propionate hydroxylase